MPMPSAPTSAALYLASKQQVRVIFQYNPTNITWTHAAKVGEIVGSSGQSGEPGGEGDEEGGETPPKKPGAGATSTATSLTGEQELQKLGKTSLKLSKLTFDGNNVTMYCGMLLDWSYAAPLSESDPNKKQLPSLIFEWGKFTVAGTSLTKIPVILTNVDVSYERFTSSGTPIRATASLQLQLDDTNNIGLQNPTSGGLPGRRGHAVIGGENLPGIAAAAYGHPGSWRALAQANGLDDPLRLRPGSMLYLPNRTELTGRGQA